MAQVTWYNQTLPCPGASTAQSLTLPSAVTLTYCTGQCSNPSYPYLDPAVRMYKGLYKIPGKTVDIRYFRCPTICMDPGTYGYCIDIYYYDWGTEWVELVSHDIYVWATLESRCVPTYGVSPVICGEGEWTLTWGLTTQVSACCSCDEGRDLSTPTLRSCADWVAGSSVLQNITCAGTDYEQDWTTDNAFTESGQGGLSWSGPSTGGTYTLEVVNNLRGVPCTEHRRRDNPCDPTGTYKTTVSGTTYSVVVS